MQGKINSRTHYVQLFIYSTKVYKVPALNCAKRRTGIPETLVYR